MKKINLYTFAGAILMILAANGCSAENMQTRANLPATVTENSSAGGSFSIITENESKSYSNKGAVKEQEQKNDTVKNRAKRIADSVSLMDGIEKANVVITGNTAIIGITLEIEMEDGRLIDLKREVEKHTKSLDGEIDHVAVTAAPELVERVMKMQEDNTSGGSRNDNGIENDALFGIIPTI